ncbi:MAG: single-stranded DNA-binding protein [Candidatus Pacebacteria bacterium]|jgi:single-strand DNA-binding protein|nr:single-stranded DNA-binding protein [Candidatus Paceibacterota bacterium]MDD5721972.1 single-stranded DNA-binding protein [Candidatus Paceibacterota bacterium]
MYLNKVFIIGNLTRDVDLRTTPSGRSVANFGVATNRVWNDASGQRQQEAEFHNVVVWGKMAELCNQYLAKGRSVLVEGRIRTRSWVDTNEQKRTRTEIVAENVRFGPRRMQEEDQFKMPPEQPEAGIEDLPVLEEDSGEIMSDDIPF